MKQRIDRSADRYGVQDCSQLHTARKDRGRLSDSTVGNTVHACVLTRADKMLKWHERIEKQMREAKGIREAKFDSRRGLRHEMPER